MGGGDDVPYVRVPRGDLLEHFDGQPVRRHQRVPHGADLHRDFGEAFLERIHLYARGDQEERIKTQDRVQRSTLFLPPRSQKVGIGYVRVSQRVWAARWLGTPC